MDELISLALAAMSDAAKKGGQQPQQPQGYDPNSRYGRMLAELQARAQAAAGAPQPAAVMPPVLPPTAPVAPQASSQPPPVAAAPPQTAHDREEVKVSQKSSGSGALQGLFEDGNSLLRAVVASEVLAPPLALRENSHWQTR